MNDFGRNGIVLLTISKIKCLRIRIIPLIFKNKQDDFVNYKFTGSFNIKCFIR